MLITKGCLVRSLINDFGGINVGDIYLVVSDIYEQQGQPPRVDVLVNMKTYSISTRNVKKL